MPNRWAAGLAAVLAVALVVAAPAAAPAASDDLTAAQLCALLPQDRGFTFTEDPTRPMCEGKAGDCGTGVPEGETSCIMVYVIQRATPAEASVLYESGQATWEPLSGLGESAVGACMWWCEVRFYRDRFWVSTYAAQPLGLGVAQELAAETDQAIQELLAGGAQPEEPGEPGEEPGEPGEEPEEPGTASGIVDVFFGNDRIRALEPDIVRVLDCPDRYLLESYLDCRGATDGHRAVDEFMRTFDEDYPNPTPRQVDGSVAYGSALFLAGMVKEDGSPLFPSIRAAMPLIQRLTSPTAAQRFIEMVAAIDAADW